MWLYRVIFVDRSHLINIKISILLKIKEEINIDYRNSLKSIFREGDFLKSILLIPFMYICVMYIKNSRCIDKVLNLKYGISKTISKGKSIKTYFNKRITIFYFVQIFKKVVKVIIKYGFITLKKLCIYFYLMINPKCKKELLFGFITIYYIDIMLILLYITVFKVTKINQTILICILLGAMFFVHTAIDYLKNNIICGKSYIIQLLYSLLLLFLLMVLDLVAFERIKNGKLTNIMSEFIAVFLCIYSVIELFKILKSIIDRGSIKLASTVGITIYFLILFFLTTSVGFFLTGKYPDYFYRDKVLVYVDGSNGLKSYMFSYSYRGAIYLLSFPQSTDLKDKNGIPAKYVPIDIYAVYCLGILINIIIVAFFISHSVSIYILKNSDEKEGYARYIEAIKGNKFGSEYKEYFKMLMKKEKLLDIVRLKNNHKYTSYKKTLRQNDKNYK